MKTLQLVRTEHEELLELREKVKSLSKKKRDKYKGTHFHHFVSVATIATRDFNGDGSIVAVGVALLALPQYFDKAGLQLRPQDLVWALEDNDIEEGRPGDQFNRTLGCMISHGRSKALRGYSGTWPKEYVHHKILELRELQVSLPLLSNKNTNGPLLFDEEFLEAVGHRYFLQEKIKKAFTIED